MYDTEDQFVVDFDDDGVGYFNVRISYLTNSGSSKEKIYTVFGRNREDARRKAASQFLSERNSLIKS